MPATSQSLGKRENNLFKNLTRLHEKKQYKKALKDCNEILKVNKDHGETLAMKGLTYNFLGKKKEAYDLVSQGIKANIMSPICWHVYGLLYRSDGNYKEAKKCYLQAMRRDKNNVHILRDLSLLQIQLRDLPGYLKTRRAMLRLKQGDQSSWYTFCLAWELLGHYDAAIDVMTAFEDITESSEKLKLGKVQASFEAGERKLYVARLYQQAKRFQDSLDYLQNSEDVIVDKHGLDIMRAELYMQLEDTDAAKQIYRKLIRDNPENYDFHLGLIKAYQISSSLDDVTVEQISELEKLYAELRKEYPRCSALKTIPLRFHQPGDQFLRDLEAYMRPALRKGVPSLFATLRFFYETSPAKASIIGDTVKNYYDSLKEHERFPGDEKEELGESPLVLLWTILFLAQHYDQLGDPQTALRFIDEAIEHTPTVVDIYGFRADIYKNAGDMQKAADAMEECRELDLADRYLNTKATIFLMNADRIEQGDATVELFITDADGNQTSLSEMQCVWYEQAAAEGYFRRKEYGKSLKKALSIKSHFEDFIEDQFDFHSYCIRKLTLRAYRDLLTFEDRLYSHDNYFNAARIIVKNYLALHERPSEPTEEELFAGLSGKELTRAKNKWKQAQRKKNQEAEKKRAAFEKEIAQKKKLGINVDEDPNGEALEAVENPLNEATPFVSSLEKWCYDRLDTHLLSFEVFFKKSKYLRAIRALRKSIDMDPAHHQVHYNTILLALVDANEIPEAVRAVFVTEMKAITNGRSAEELNNEFGTKHDNALTRLAVARAELLIHPESKAALKEKICAVDKQAKREELEIIHSFVLEIYGADEAANFQKEAHELFPLARAFQTSQEKREDKEGDS